MGFVTDAGWIDGNAMDGMRACLKDEFSSLYIFHHRGNARTSGERRRKEKGNVFGGGSRSPIAISILVNNPNSDVSGQINFHDIGDYLTEQEKLDTIGRVASITGQARSTLTRENGQPTDSNLAQPSSVILLRARTPICASVF